MAENTTNVNVDKSKTTNIGQMTNNNTTTIINKGGNRKAHNISSAINLRSIGIILIFLPLIIFLFATLFDLNNGTLFRTKVVNGIELTYFDTFAYVKGLEQSGDMLKATLKNLFIDSFNIPNYSATIPPDIGSDWISNALEEILKVLMYAVNLFTWFVNTMVTLPLRALLTILYFLPIALKTILSICAIDTSENFILNSYFDMIQKIINFITTMEIPQLGQ